jgi:hypothetical protein
MAEPGNDIPNFLMLEQIPNNYVQQLETDLLEPVVFSDGSATTDGFCRFTLQNKGFLHSHSKIFIALKPAGTTRRGFLAPHVGIGKIIKRAVLKIGNKSLNELDSWSGLHAVKSSLISNENNLEREQYLTGRAMNNNFIYNDDSSIFADTVGLDNGVEYNGTDLRSPAWAVLDGLHPTECPSYMIDLSDLFPFLKVNQLPLYMIKEPINIELTFQPQHEQRIQVASTDTADTATEIVRDQLKFCADYIYYGATDEMERYAMANKDMTFSFVDYRLVEHSTTQALLAGGVIRNLGMANRMVPRVITLLNQPNAEAQILGNINSMAPTIPASGVLDTTLRYNLRYNDRFEFTTDVENMARLFSILQQAEGVPFLTRQQYSNGGIAGDMTSRTYNTRQQDTNLAGHFFNLSTKLSNGRVGQRGIELHITGAFPAGVDLVRCYCEYVRVAKLTVGIFEIYNA